MSTQRIVIESYVNPLVRSFYTSAPLSSGKLHGILPEANIRKIRKEGYCETKDTDTTLKFFEIKGIIEVVLNLYEVHITIARACNWLDIAPQVVDYIKELLYWDEVDIQEIIPSACDHCHGTHSGSNIDLSSSIVP